MAAKVTSAGIMRRIGKFAVVPVCLLLLNALEEVVVYKLGETIENPHIRTAALLLMFTAGFALIAALLVPWTSTLVKDLHSSSQKKGGATGILVFYLLLGGVFYAIYYVIYIRGPQFLLPRAWR